MSQRVTSYAELLHALLPERTALLDHPVYAAVSDAKALRAFMQTHVFAVWDFMSLLKSLQQRLTCVTVPWTPPWSRVAARLVNAIVVAEESDEIAMPGGEPTNMSHYELYLDAMTELGVDTAPVGRLLEAITKGANVQDALEAAGAPPHVRDFVLQTFAFIDEGHVETVAASFLIGREDLVPEMFRRLLPTVSADRQARSFERYLERHVEVDEGEHGPLARKLLSELCGDDETSWARATEAGRAALVSRKALWDGVLHGLNA